MIYDGSKNITKPSAGKFFRKNFSLALGKKKPPAVGWFL